jgi:hypothetical protein
MTEYLKPWDLDQFLGAYSHQDWVFEADGWQGIVDQFSASPHRPDAVSSFATVEEASTAVSAALQQKKEVIDAWVAAGASDRLRLVIPFEGGNVLARGARETTPGTSVLVVLKGDGNGQWIVLTGFPQL